MLPVALTLILLFLLKIYYIFILILFFEVTYLLFILNIERLLLKLWKYNIIKNPFREGAKFYLFPEPINANFVCDNDKIIVLLYSSVKCLSYLIIWNFFTREIKLVEVIKNINFKSLYRFIVNIITRLITGIPLVIIKYIWNNLECSYLSIKFNVFNNLSIFIEMNNDKKFVVLEGRVYCDSESFVSRELSDKKILVIPSSDLEYIDSNKNGFISLYLYPDSYSAILIVNKRWNYILLDLLSIINYYSSKKYEVNNNMLGYYRLVNKIDKSLYDYIYIKDDLKIYRYLATTKLTYEINIWNY